MWGAGGEGGGEEAVFTQVGPTTVACAAHDRLGTALRRHLQEMKGRRRGDSGVRPSRWHMWNWVGGGGDYFGGRTLT